MLNVVRLCWWLRISSFTRWLHTTTMNVLIVCWAPRATQSYSWRGHSPARLQKGESARNRQPIRWGRPISLKLSGWGWGWEIDDRSTINHRRCSDHFLCKRFVLKRWRTKKFSRNEETNEPPANFTSHSFKSSGWSHFRPNLSAETLIICDAGVSKRIFTVV